MAIRRRRVQRKRTSRRRTGRRIRGVSAYGFSGAYPTLPAIGARRGRRLPVGKKRKYGGSYTSTKRQKTIKDKGGYNQWCKYLFKRKFGRLTQRKQNYKDDANIQMIWRRTAALSGNGAILMSYWRDATQVALPFYIWELNQYPGQSTAVTCMQPRFTTAGLSWDVANGVDNAGNVNSYWQYAKADSAPGGPRFIMRWVNAKLDLWGAKAQPTVYTVGLVQFNDDDMVPVANGLTTPAITEYWREFFNPLIYNPSASNASVFNKPPMKFMWRKQVEIDPTSSTETDADPHCKSLNLWFSMNRRCNFAWKRTVGAQPAVADVGTSKWDNFTSTEVSQQVDPRARVYLVVYCNKFYQSDTTYAMQTSQNTPSISANIRVGYLGNSDL